jgi:MYXO-CTERM domain-containing protein
MELVIFVNGTQQADWKTTFPDYQNKANFHLWKAYPNFAELTLEAGLSVIKFQAPFKHLNLDYVDVALEGGATGGSGGTGGTANGGTAAGNESGGASSGAGTTNGGSANDGSANGAAVGGASSTAGSTSESGGTSTAGTASAGSSSAGNAAGGAPDSTENRGCSCRIGEKARSSNRALLALPLVGWLLRRRRRTGS